ncbi:MAG: L-threonylcarbamoyladenylate synthase [Aureibaculum sp.]|nr:L-threonylcarbamoyladenylate synthase [Aureibaculum sp.]
MTSSINSSYFNLKKGGNILYPTDTVWGIGCDATNEKAVTNIFHIKKREESKSLVILVNNIEMLRQYVGEIPTRLIDILKNTTKPTTVIYKTPKGLAKNVIAKDNTVAIRIAQDKFCQKLIKKFGKPIVSTSANISGRPTPSTFKEIDHSILGEVDYVVNLYQDKINDSPSKIIKIGRDGELEVIRE